MILKKDRKETKFEVMDNMLDIWKQITELSFRGFGKRMRKKPKIPKNFNEWSEESQNRWIVNTEGKLQQQEQWDMNFVNNETTVELVQAMFHSWLPNYSRYMSKRQIKNMVDLYDRLFK